uniref:Uncharacterized protein n=1 Tax=Oryza punctata TaxID=4537 RepID=A0A0E0L9D7_ORYPU
MQPGSRPPRAKRKVFRSTWISIVRGGGGRHVASVHPVVPVPSAVATRVQRRRLSCDVCAS